jgi:Ca2+-binding RTX toxin-like protein
VDEDQPIDILLPAGTFADVDGDSLTVTAVLAGGDPLPSWLSFDGARFTGTPPAHFNGPIDISVRAHDGALGVSDTFRLTISPVNDAPTLTALLDDARRPEDTILDLAIPEGSFADLDGDSLTLSATLAGGDPLPSWLSFDGTRFTGTPPADFNGSIDIVVTAGDGRASASDTFRLTFDPVNDRPTLSAALADLVSGEDSAIDIALPEGSFADVDGDSLTLTATLAGGAGLPDWLTFAGGRLTGTPPLNFNGVLDIEVLASDGALAVSDVFRLTVSARNDPPAVFAPLPDAVFAEDRPIDIAIPAGTFKDADDDALTLTATLADGAALPAWMTFSQGRITGSPPADFNGILDIKVTASDGAMTVSDIFRLTILAVNDAPRLERAISDVVRAEDMAIDVAIPQGTFADVDGDSLALTARRADGTALPSWLQFDGERFTGTPPANFNGFILLEVFASDGLLETSGTFRLTIDPQNDAPALIQPIAAASVAEDQTVDISLPAGTFGDADGDPLTLSATLAGGAALPSWLSFQSGRFTGTPPANFNGAIDIAVSASDGLLSTSATFRLTVSAVNDAPVVLQPLTDRSQLDTVPVDIQIPAGTFSDVDADSLTLTARLVGGGALPSWLQFAGGRFTGTAPSNSNLDLDIEVIASDGAASASDVFTLSIRPDMFLITGTAGSDVLTGADARRDKILGLAGSDTLSGRGGDDVIEAGDGDDTLRGEGGSDILYGGIGNDVFDGDTADGAADQMFGEAGRDTMRGGAGDIVDGGADPDTMRVTTNSATYLGGAGNDFFLVDGGTSGNIVHGGDGTSDLLTAYGPVRLSGLSGVERFNGSGSVGSAASIIFDMASVNLSGATFEGKLDMVAGLDTGITIVAPTDLTNGLTASLLRLFGAAGADSLTGSKRADEVSGRAGDDILDGGAGNDILRGNGGNDVYRFSRGSGQDVVRDSDATGGGGFDRIEFGSDIAARDVTVWFADGGQDLLLSIAGTTDRLRLDDTNSNPDMKIEEVRFADGTVWTATDLAARAVAAPHGDNEYHGTAGDDVLQGGDNADTIYGYAGADSISGFGGADALDGGDGDDTLSGGEGSDVVTGAGGADRIGGGAGDDLLSGGDGNDIITQDAEDGGADRIFGGAGSDFIWGGSLDEVDGGDGYDTIWLRGFNGTFLGGADEDVFHFGNGTQRNIIRGGSGSDRLALPGGASAHLLELSEVERLVAAATTSTTRSKITIDADSADLSASGYEGHFDLIAGNSAGMTLIAPLALLSAVASSLRIYGAGAADILVGSNQADELFGQNGDDRLTGGGGNDILTGGTGSDIAAFAGSMSSYQLLTGGGSLSIVDLDPSDGDDGTDTLIGIETLMFAGGETMSLTSPIVIDLDGDGNELVDAGGSNARFDMNGDGKTDDTSWFGSGDALLFLDRDGNGTVTSAKEFSFVQDAEDARSDLEGLRTFDTDKDGKLSAGDAEFGKFRLWQDRNGDGVAAAAEITTLAASNIASLSLAGTPTNVTASAGSAVAINTGKFTRSDGTQGMFSDAALTYFSGAPGAGAQPRIDLTRQSFGKKSSKYRIMAEGGQLFVALTKAKGELDPGSGRIGPSSLLSFKGKTIGMLAPIILDLDGDGVEMVARDKSKARFDMDGDGSRDDTGWVGKGDGFLVIDRDSDGLITSASELSFLTEKPGARSDLDALAALDSNRDRKLDATDLRFGELKVWVDGNRNGITDAGELKTLQELSIASIDLVGSATRQTVKPGQNILLATGSFTLTDGTVRSLGDAALAFKPGGGSSSFAAVAAAAADAMDLRLPEGSGDMPSGEATARQAGRIEAREMMDSQLELTSALRAGLGEDGPSFGSDGLARGIPAHVNPFDYFAELQARQAASDSSAANVPASGVSVHRQDLPALRVADGGEDLHVAPAGAASSVDDLRVARMVQTMAAFGRSQGEGDLRSRDRDGPRFDYFA